jgi:hypothetical protein
MMTLLLKRVASLCAMGSLVGCVMPSQTQTAVSVPLMQNTLGRVTPVYNPPPGTPFRCVDLGASASLFKVPGDPSSGIGLVYSPVATMGNRRGDWLLVVSRTGIIGWALLPHETPIGQSKWVISCRVYQDAGGRLVFHSNVGNGTF